MQLLVDMFLSFIVNNLMLLIVLYSLEFQSERESVEEARDIASVCERCVSQSGVFSCLRGFYLTKIVEEVICIERK